MNTLQSELDKINQQLEILTYRKTQLDAIMGEYSDVINRVRNLISTMEDANVEPSNLLFEIEGIIHGVSDAEMTAETPEMTAEDSQTQKTPQTPSTAPQTGDDSQSDVAQHFTFDLRLFPKAEFLQVKLLEPIQDNNSSGYKSPDNTIDSNTAVCNQQNLDTEAVIAVTNAENAPATDTDDDDSCDTDGLDDDDYPFDYDCDDETSTPEQRGNSLLFEPNTYWDNGSSVRVFIPKKRRYKGELEAIVKDCIEQGLAERYDLDECGTDWIIGLAPVTDEMTVNGIIDNFYPKHFDGDATPQPTPEPARLMVAVPAVVTPDKNQPTEPLETSQSNSSSGYKLPDNTINNNQGVCNHQNQDSVSDTTVTDVKNEASTPPPKTQLNERAWRRNDTLLIGFTNKRLLNTWTKWAKDSWGDRVKIDDLETLEGFDHCLSILWFGQADWERLKALNYSLKPTEQNKQKQQPAPPQKVALEDIKAVLKQLHDDGLPAILKGELLASHFNSLTANELEQHLENLAEQGLINLGDHSIILKFPEPTISTDNPTFEYEQVDEKTTKIYADGMLIGLAKDCGTHWESPQFKGETFPNRRDVVNALWQLVNQF